MFLSASSAIPRTSNGAAEASTAETTTYKVNYQYLDFDPDAIEYCQWQVMMPGDYDGGTITAKFLWGAASGSGNVIWGIQGLALADNGTLDTDFGTAQTVTDTLLATSKLQITSATSAITIAGTPTSAKWVIFQAYRKATDVLDTFTADAELIGVQLTYTRDPTV
jgi:hypothetical protein